MDRWFNMYLPNIDRCLIVRSRNPQRDRTFKNLKPYYLRDLSGVFILLVVGISLSVFVFLCEVITFYSLKKLRKFPSTL